MRIYFIRHADPDYKNNTITSAGHQEARALAKRLAAEPWMKFIAPPTGGRLLLCNILPRSNWGQA